MSVDRNKSVKKRASWHRTGGCLPATDRLCHFKRLRQTARHLDRQKIAMLQTHSCICTHTHYTREKCNWWRVSGRRPALTLYSRVSRFSLSLRLGRTLPAWSLMGRWLSWPSVQFRDRQSGRIRKGWGSESDGTQCWESQAGRVRYQRNDIKQQPQREREWVREVKWEKSQNKCFKEIVRTKTGLHS